MHSVCSGCTISINVQPKFRKTHMLLIAFFSSYKSKLSFKNCMLYYCPEAIMQILCPCNELIYENIYWYKITKLKFVFFVVYHYSWKCIHTINNKYDDINIWWFTQCSHVNKFFRLICLCRPSTIVDVSLKQFIWNTLWIFSEVGIHDQIHLCTSLTFT